MQFKQCVFHIFNLCGLPEFEREANQRKQLLFNFAGKKNTSDLWFKLLLELTESFDIFQNIHITQGKRLKIY